MAEDVTLLIIVLAQQTGGDLTVELRSVSQLVYTVERVLVLVFASVHLKEQETTVRLLCVTLLASMVVRVCHQDTAAVQVAMEENSVKQHYATHSVLMVSV